MGVQTGDCRRLNSGSIYALRSNKSSVLFEAEPKNRRKSERRRSNNEILEEKNPRRFQGAVSLDLGYMRLHDLKPDLESKKSQDDYCKESNRTQSCLLDYEALTIPEPEDDAMDESEGAAET